jgi:catalase
MRVQNVSDPVYAPNSKGGPAAGAEGNPLVEKWAASGEFVRAAYTKRKDDDDYVQARTLIRKVMDEDQRKRLVSNVVDHLSAGVSEAVLERALGYWHNIDEGIGTRIAKDLKARSAGG